MSGTRLLSDHVSLTSVLLPAFPSPFPQTTRRSAAPETDAQEAAGRGALADLTNAKAQTRASSKGYALRPRDANAVVEPQRAPVKEPPEAPKQSEQWRVRPSASSSERDARTSRERRFPARASRQRMIRDANRNANVSSSLTTHLS